MTDTSRTGAPTVVREFFVDQIGRLGPLEFVAVASSTGPEVPMEIVRLESGALEVRVPPRPPSYPLDVPIRAKLVEGGFHSDEPSNPTKPWARQADSAEAACDVALETIRDVFGVGFDGGADLVHGSHRAEEEARLRLAALRERVEGLIAELLGHAPETDDDGDYLYPVGHAQIRIVPRVLPGALAVVRVLAITNIGVNVDPELGLFLARLNFGLMFGRFTLDVEHRSIWFDETLLGDVVSDEELKFTIRVVATTANEWDQRLQQMFGGTTHRDLETANAKPSPKPGYGGYTGYL